MQSNPYDVLGIRPGAAGDELEHAYRARCSQYHPDRYANADAETQAWATAKMQEVTTAYRAITSGEVSSASTGSPSRQKRSTEKTDQPSRTLHEALKAKAEYFVSDKIFLAPNIPLKKIDGALSKYGQGINPDEIIALLDNTVFGSAKDGLLITSSEIRFRENPFTDIEIHKLGTIKSIAVDGHTLFINGRKKCWMNLPGSDDFQALIAALSDFLSKSAADNSGNSAYATAISRWESISRNAGKILIEEMEGDELDAYPMISKIEKIISRLSAGSLELAENESLSSGRPASIILAEILHVVTIITIGNCFSGIPKNLRHEMGEDFFSLIGIFIFYSEKFVEQFEDDLGIEFSIDTEQLVGFLTIFSQDDDAWEKMTMPRAQLFSQALQNFGISPNDALKISSASAKVFDTWLDEIN